MKKAFILLFISTLMSSLVNGQSTKAQAVNEIDRLYQKYKGMDSVEITNVYGTFKAVISVDLNETGKPKEITISGAISEDGFQIVDLFLNDMTIRKKANGYKEVQTDISPMTNGVALTKGFYYTRISKSYGDLPSIHTGYSDPIPSMHYMKFSITSGDVRRAAGSKSKQVDF
jgi:hypothetical protein